MILQISTFFIPYYSFNWYLFAVYARLTNQICITVILITYSSGITACRFKGYIGLNRGPVRFLTISRVHIPE